LLFRDQSLEPLSDLSDLIARFEFSTPIDERFVSVVGSLNSPILEFTMSKRHAQHSEFRLQRLEAP